MAAHVATCEGLPGAGGAQQTDACELATVARAARGDPEACSWLLSRYRGRVLRLATMILRSADEAEDAAQESFIRAFRGLSSFRGPLGFYTWLCRITVRTCLDHQRKRRPPRLEVRAPHAGDAEDAAVSRLVVQALLDQLSAPVRAALVLREVDGLEYQEIARVVGVPVGTVRSRLHSARARFRELYLDAMQEADRV